MLPAQAKCTSLSLSPANFLGLALGELVGDPPEIGAEQGTQHLLLVRGEGGGREAPAARR